MNTVKLQDSKSIYRNLWNFYTLIINYQRRQIKKKISFTTASKSLKYLEINLTKEMKTCTLKTIRYWWKKLKKTQKNGKIFCTDGLEELILFKCPYFPKQSTDSSNPYQNSNDIFNRTWTYNSKICMEPQKILNSQNNLEEEEQNCRYHTLTSNYS